MAYNEDNRRIGKHGRVPQQDVRRGASSPGTGAGRHAARRAQSAGGQNLSATQQAAQQRTAHSQAAAQQRVVRAQAAAKQQAAQQRAARQHAAQQQVSRRQVGAASGQVAPGSTTAYRPVASQHDAQHPSGRRVPPVAAAGAGAGAYAAGKGVNPANPNNPAGVSGDHDSELIRVRKKRSKHRTAKRVAIIVAAVLVVVIGAAAAFGIWYTSTIAGNMAMNEEDAQKLDEALGGAVSDVNSQPFYMLVLGSDNWEGHGARSDAMMLARIDPSQHMVTLVSVPRDTPYYIDGEKVKINEAYARQGAAGAVTAVQELTGVDVSYYVEVEFSGLETFIDSIGGIVVDVPYAIDYEVYTHDQPTVHIDAGEQLLDGEQTVALARMRTAYGADQEAIRQSNVRAIVMSLIDTVLKSPPMEIPGLVQNLSGCISTNMDMGEMVNLATNFASAGNATVYTCTGPYEGAVDPETQLWLCYENPEAWATLMEAVDSGQNPESAETQMQGR